MNTDLIYDTKRKMLAKYNKFASEVAKANIQYKDDLKFHTAATDGKNIFVDPNYFASLSEDDRLFLLAHETMHIKFMHMLRLVDKDGNNRDMDIWNEATDAIINANLERDGFTIKEGYVNMPEALNYSAEQLYEKLLQEKQNQDQSQNQNGSGQGSGEEGMGQDEENEQDDKQTSGHGDDHSLWEEAFKEYQNREKQEKNDESNENNKDTNSKDPNENEENEEEQTFIDIDERQEFEENRKEKRKKFEERSKKIKNNIRESHNEEKIKLENIGESKEEIDWKLLIRREIEKTETIWSKRRSIAENNYAYRLEENDIEDEAETEVMIDVSGSVDLDLVKAFLRQLKPLVKQSKLKVGCFNEKFWGLVEVKNVRDIDNFTIPQKARGSSTWTEDWDLAVRSFTKKREINKIVFTDGYPCPGTMPKEDLKKENVIWLVYGNKDFNPCCGKVINITEKQIEHLEQIEKNLRDTSR